MKHHARTHVTYPKQTWTQNGGCTRVRSCKQIWLICIISCVLLHDIVSSDLHEQNLRLAAYSSTSSATLAVERVNVLDGT